MPKVLQSVCNSRYSMCVLYYIYININVIYILIQFTDAIYDNMYYTENTAYTSCIQTQGSVELVGVFMWIYHI